MAKVEIAQNQDYSILVDMSKNRLYIKTIGFWKEESTHDSYITDQKKAIKQLKPNFTVLADMREFKQIAPEFISKQEGNMKDLTAAGMYRVAEVFPTSAVASMQLERVTKKIDRMHNKQFDSLEEGEKWLDDELKKIE